MPQKHCPICKKVTKQEIVLTGRNNCYAKYKYKCLVCGVTGITPIPKPPQEL